MIRTLYNHDREWSTVPVPHLDINLDNSEEWHVSPAHRRKIEDALGPGPYTDLVHNPVEILYAAPQE